MADIYRRNKEHLLWSKSPGKEKQEQTSKPRDSKHSVQLFAFDIEQVENNDMGLRPKRKLKSIARFDSVSFDMAAPSCKIGEGFACPRCSGICSYDSRECEFCQLQCYYEAGIGVVVLKERQACVEQDRNLVPLIHEKVARRVETKKMESKKSRCSSEEVFHDSSHFTYDDDAHNPDQPAEGLPDGWIVRKIPRDSGHRCDNYWYSPKERYKFRTKPSAQNFLMCLEKTDGDESAAMTLCKNYSKKSTLWDNNAAQALVEMANQKNGEVTEESRHSKQPFIESSPPKERVISDFAPATAPVRAGDDDFASVNRGITPVLVHLYRNELKPDERDCVKLPRRRVSAHAAGVELSNRQEKIDAANYTGFANQVVTLQGTHVEMANRLRENEAALIAAETTIASLRLQASSAMNNRQQLADAVLRLANARHDIGDLSKQSDEMSNLDIERIISTVSTERDQLEKEVDNKTAELLAMREELSNSSSKVMELQSEFQTKSAQFNVAEERVHELLSENNRAKEVTLSMQAKNRVVMMELDSANARFETLVLEKQGLLEKSETEIECLKQQAAKRMSQVYELTDLLSKALAEKTELHSKLKSGKTDLPQIQDTIASQTPEISQLDSSNLPLAHDTVNSQSISTSSLKANGTYRIGLETEAITEAVANSNSLGMTVNELQDQVERLSTELNAAKAANTKLTHQIDAKNSKYRTLDTKYKECINELEKVSNEKANVEAMYNDIIHELEESTNQRNEETKVLNEAVPASQASVQVSTLTTARDEWKAKAEEAATEISRLQSTIVILNNQRITTEARFLDQLSDIGHSAETLSTLKSEKVTLDTKVRDCVARLDTAFEDMPMKIINAAEVHGDQNDPNRINVICLEGNEVLPQTEKLEKELIDADAELRQLIVDAKNLDKTVQQSLRKIEDEFLTTTKDCKAKLNQRLRNIQALKSDIAKTKALKNSSDGNSTAFLTSEVGDLSDEARHQNKSSVSIASDSVGDDYEPTNVQLFAFDVTAEEYNWGRPKRKLKSIARFESMTFDPKKAAGCKIGEGFSCPRCSAVCSYDAKECEDCQLACYYEAGIGVVVLKERKVTPDLIDQPLSKSILCHCLECNKRDMTMRGLTSHYAKNHGGKPNWQKTGYSCPFCPSPTTDSKSQSEIEAHVNLYHPCHRLQKPNTPKEPLGKHPEVHPSTKSHREKKCPPSWAWAKIEHVKLLPGGGKEYPRELPRVIDFIEAQCKNQEETTEKSRRDWSDIFKDESEAEVKAQNEERLLYGRGIRNRSGLADQERLEKLRYAEKEDELRIQYEYEGRTRRSTEDIETSKLCSRCIIFSDNNETHFGEKAGVCLNHGCQLCKHDNVHRQQLLLENEINEWKLSDPTAMSPLIQTTVTVLSPDVRVIDVISFVKAAAGEEEKSKVDSGDKEVESAKLMFLEESKLEKLNSTRRALEFIKSYNEGFVTNAWARVRKDKSVRL